jgi:UDP-3-O-[3-hydroxymyristoyl] glucosamine N-acyltransferase
MLMKGLTIGLLAAAGGVLLWVAQRSRQSAQPGATVPSLPNAAAAPSRSAQTDIDPKMVITPKADIDPKMVITPKADIDPKMVITPKADIDPKMLIDPPPPRSPENISRVRPAQDL